MLCSFLCCQFVICKLGRHMSDATDGRAGGGWAEEAVGIDAGGRMVRCVAGGREREGASSGWWRMPPSRPAPSSGRSAALLRRWTARRPRSPASGRSVQGERGGRSARFERGFPAGRLFHGNAKRPGDVRLCDLFLFGGGVSVGIPGSIPQFHVHARLSGNVDECVPVGLDAAGASCHADGVEIDAADRAVEGEAGRHDQGGRMRLKGRRTPRVRANGVPAGG